ncbi:peptidase dimerization domain-containing protein, partial [Pseudolysinimonas sp.]
ARLARAIQRVSRQPPAHLPPTAYPMFAALGRRARGIVGVAYRHPRLLRAVLLGALSRGTDEANALIRTTRVVTRLRGAAADNVLPEVATAHVNMRIAPGSTLDGEVARIRRDIADARIAVSVVAGGDPPPVAPTTGSSWDRVVRSLAASHPDAVPVPYAMLGATDGRHFTRLTPAVYRFTPFELSKAELAGLHAIDESIRVDAYLRGIGFYRALLELS